MSKTNELRKLITSILTESSFVERNNIKSVTYEYADDETLYPHIIYTIEDVNMGDLSRNDLSVVIDIYDKSESANNVESIVDDIEKMFNSKNLPQENVLPTFFLEYRRTVLDEDKKIRHKQLEISIQNYER